MPKLSDFTFNKNSIDSLRCPADKKYVDRRDSTMRGLIVRAYASGKKTYSVQLDASTRRKVGNASLITVTNARTKATTMLAAHESGDTPDSSKAKKPTLGNFLSGQYMEWAKVQNRWGEPDTRRLISALGSLRRKRLDELSMLNVEGWKRIRKVKPSTFNRELAHLKAALSRAVEWKLITGNPAAKVRLRQDKAGKRVRFLSDTERKRLDKALSESAGYLPAIVRLVMQTGLRRGEVLNLYWYDIDLNTKRLTVRASNAKSNRDRRIPLNPAAITALRDWQMRSGSREGLVFPNSATGLPFRDLKKSWKTLIDSSGIKDFRFHDMRHDFASRLVQNGVDLYQVKELMGHSTIQLTERYAHLSSEQLQGAVDLIG